MTDMDDFKEQLNDHEDRIKSLELTRMDTLKALSDLDGKHEQRLRDVKQGLEKQIERMEKDARERDKANGQRMDRFENKLDVAIDKLRRSTPAWVGPIIGLILAAAGWGIEIAIRAHGG